MNCVTRLVGEDFLRPIIASLPVMRGVAQCVLFNPDPAELGSLLRMFPDVRELGVEFCNMSDVELQVLACCAKLDTLRL